MKNVLIALATLLLAATALAATPVPCDTTPGCVQRWKMIADPGDFYDTYIVNVALSEEALDYLAAGEMAYVVVTQAGINANPVFADHGLHCWIPVCSPAICRNHLDAECLNCNANGFVGPCSNTAYYMIFTDGGSSGHDSGCEGQCNEQTVAVRCSIVRY